MYFHWYPFVSSMTLMVSLSLAVAIALFFPEKKHAEKVIGFLISVGITMIFLDAFVLIYSMWNFSYQEVNTVLG